MDSAAAGVRIVLLVMPLLMQSTGWYLTLQKIHLIWNPGASHDQMAEGLME